ncbi:uncharacterized protein PV07_11505 [Cladophialophora immunda]|uniref:Uncharacterized protein n=1 Tax=Cladophialophora immunda TaxID=569365 RepID=A0A0D2BY82_9EURO|nr:uncharacterized protein PV07_11505 [Cladophialophora immunda]KIW23295.1 hypothetical protein PV07_11505 [Cladophialophora immunda]
MLRKWWPRRQQPFPNRSNCLICTGAVSANRPAVEHSILRAETPETCHLQRTTAAASASESRGEGRSLTNCCMIGRSASKSSSGANNSARVLAANRLQRAGSRLPATWLPKCGM